MSRTYKTDPLRVKLSKPECSKLKVVEDHDHRFGECDLPENPYNNTGWVARFNDHDDTTWEDVKSVLLEAGKAE